MKKTLILGIFLVMLGNLSACSSYQSGLETYREENSYAGMPNEFQDTMNDMGLEHAYTGETNTAIEEILLVYDCVDSADANVVTSNGEVYRVSVTLTGNGWMNFTKALADEIRKCYPDCTVTFYDTNVNIIYSE